MVEIKKNEEYCIDIIDINHEGLGVGKIDGYTVFVGGVVVGERVNVKLVKVNKTYGYGKLLAIEETSSDRVDDVCGVARRCGGCAVSHVDYLAQLRYKMNLVRENMLRIGGVDTEVEDIIGAKDPLYYRNKAQFPVKNVDGKVRMGFYMKNSHNIVPCGECSIQHPKINKVCAVVERFLQERDIQAYDEGSGEGSVRHVLVRVGEVTGDVMVVIVSATKDVPHIHELVGELRSNIYGLKSVVVNVNKKNTNVILGNEDIVIWGQDYIEDCIGKLRFRISPKSFYQVNSKQMEKLYDKVIEYAGLDGDEIVFDLYCGIGTITLLLASKAKYVYGVEVVADAVENAKFNAERNKIDNVEFLEGRAENIVPKVYDDGVRAEVVVVDPPRKGCDCVLIDTIVAMNPARIVYVSCNPATLARDVKILCQEGYLVNRITPVDMFPMTMHVETVVCLSQQKPDDQDILEI